MSEDFCFFYRPGSLFALYAAPHQEFPRFLREFGSRHGIHVELRELDPGRFETYSAYRRLPGSSQGINAAMPFLPLNELPALFPHVVSWITDLDKQARESGRTLTPLEYNLARNVGVARPEDVRILSVPQIPLPTHPRIRQLAQQIGLLTSNTGGLTAIHSVIARLDCTNSPKLLAHEFSHVEQYERLGTEGFLREYIQQLAAHGYQSAPFELEAEAKAVKACRDAGLRIW